MANICEEKTKEYGVSLVMTDKFVENLSIEAQKNTRILDICYDDEDGPIGFYTMDFETEDLYSDEEELDIESENAEGNKKASGNKLFTGKLFLENLCAGYRFNWKFCYP